MDNRQEITQYIKAEALRLGFYACGAACVQPIDEEEQLRLKRWLSLGGNGNMNYLAQHFEKRCNPSLLFEGAKSIVSVALNYFPKRTISPNNYSLSYYAYGKDYHTVVKDKLEVLLKGLQEKFSVYGRCFCDTAPLLERYWAWKSGLGWVGKNQQLIIPQAGSYFFLGELLLDVELEYDAPKKSLCGNCTNCYEACPTHALSATGFDARRCLSYLTIENREDIPTEFTQAMGTCIYGCDRCLLSCPHNRFAKPTEVQEFAPSEELLAMDNAAWKTLSPEKYVELFRGSAVKRCKYAGLLRNIRAVKEEKK